MKNHEIIDDRWVLHNLILRGEYWMARVRDMKLKTVRYYSTRKKVKREALTAAHLWIKRLAAEETAPIGVVFEVAHREFLSLKEVRPITAQGTARDAAVLVYPTFGKRLVSSITFADVERWHQALRDRPLSPRTRRLHLGRLSDFFSWAVKRRYTYENPVEGIKLPKADPVEITVITPEQARVLLSTRMPPRLRLAILITLHTGLRRKNVGDLFWSDLDLARRRIFIPWDRMKNKKDFETGIHPELMAELLKLPFLDKTAQVLGRPAKAKVIKRPDLGFLIVRERSGLPPMRWHDLRHSFGTWVGLRFPHALKQALMAHKAKDVTDQYSHISLEHKLAAIDTFPPLLSSPECASVPVSQRTI